MEPFDSPELAFAVEIMFGMLPRYAKMPRESAKQLHDLCKMVVIFSEVLSSPGLKQEVSSRQFEHHTSETSNVSRRVISPPNYDFRRTVLASLNVACEVIVNSTGVPKVHDIQFNLFVGLWASFESAVFYTH